MRSRGVRYDAPLGQTARQKKPSDKHWYAYDVLLDGEIIVADSRDPTHDLARALLARGIKGRVDVFDGKTDWHRYTANVEAAARLRVSSDLRTRIWTPIMPRHVLSRTGEGDFYGDAHR